MPAGRPPIYTDKLDEIVKLLGQGKTVRYVEKATGVPKSTVARLGKQGKKLKAEDFL